MVLFSYKFPRNSLCVVAVCLMAYHIIEIILTCIVFFYSLWMYRLITHRGHEIMYINLMFLMQVTLTIFGVNREDPTTYWQVAIYFGIGNLVYAILLYLKRQRGHRLPGLAVMMAMAAVTLKNTGYYYFLSIMCGFSNAFVVVGFATRFLCFIGLN